MNMNEECLLHFLKEPNHLEVALEQFKEYIFSDKMQSPIEMNQKELVHKSLFW